jgi:hypothetical protein
MIADDAILESEPVVEFDVDHDRTGESRAPGIAQTIQKVSRMATITAS